VSILAKRGRGVWLCGALGGGGRWAPLPGEKNRPRGERSAATLGLLGVAGGPIEGVKGPGGPGSAGQKTMGSFPPARGPLGAWDAPFLRILSGEQKVRWICGWGGRNPRSDVIVGPA